MGSLFTVLIDARLTVIAPSPLTDTAIRLRISAMRQCPDCSARYDDDINFCAKDGRSLLGVVAPPSRLCPHCANSIAEDAVQCPYCKADIESAPKWLIRDEQPQGTKTASVAKGKAMTPKIILIAGVILCVLAAAMLGMGILGKSGSGDTTRLLDDKVKELLVKEEHVKAVDAELVKVREEAAANAKDAADLKARLAESQKELAAAEQRLSAANRELDRLSARRAQPEPRAEPRPVERTPAPPRSARRPAEPGVYETVRATAVHEQPAESSRVLSQVGRGTRVNVVRSNGDWLEVVSRRGNPPGFILRDDTMFVGASN